MRFIGNKELVTSEIIDLLRQQGLTNKRLTLFDAFCGTGAVADSVKDLFNIIANDSLRWCVVYTRGRICANECLFHNLGFDPFIYFNSNTKKVNGFFYNNYSPSVVFHLDVYLSNVFLARLIFSRIASTLAVQTNVLGFSL